MKKIVIRVAEVVFLFITLGYLSVSSLNLLSKLLPMLEVEFITYRPGIFLTLMGTAFWSAMVVAALAIILEWKREKRKISYCIYLSYLTAPVVALLILFIITAINVERLPEFQTTVSTDIIPMHLIFIGYALYPIVHLGLIIAKGQNQPAQVNPCNPPENPRIT